MHLSVAKVLWVAFSIPPGSLSLVKYHIYFAINNYLDQRRLSDFGRISTDALECREVFLVAYTPFNLHLEICA
jgi:hypothetical protein